jgi:hypothetical protein
MAPAPEPTLAARKGLLPSRLLAAALAGLTAAAAVAETVLEWAGKLAGILLLVGL